jgi:hypothetical protein
MTPEEELNEDFWFPFIHLSFLFYVFEPSIPDINYLRETRLGSRCALPENKGPFRDCDYLDQMITSIVRV